MTDDWEDWENEDFEVPVLSIPNEEQLKRLEERRLIEECDNDLTRDLFSKGEDLEVIKTKPEQKLVTKYLPETEKKTKNNKQQENELKQKELSKKTREDKLRRAREREIYGEAEEDDEYAKYDDMFY